MDQTQMEWQCCGVYGYEDWFNTTWAGKTTQCGMETHYTVPLSCCKTQQTSESTVTIAKPCFCGNETDVEAINHNGCLTTVFGSDGETILYLVIAVFGMAALQLIGITLTICIYQRLREINYRRYWCAQIFIHYVESGLQFRDVFQWHISFVVARLTRSWPRKTSGITLSLPLNVMRERKRMRETFVKYGITSLQHSKLTSHLCTII